MKSILKFIILKIFITSSLLYANDHEKVIIMGYKDMAKPPLIGNKNDNSGLYLELFERAAKRIGYRLEVKRLPKKRLHNALEQGTVDFYPGSSFSQKRTKYLYFLPNGLQTKEVLVSKSTQKEINHMSEVKGVLIVEPGSSKLEWSSLYPNIRITKLSKLSMSTIIKGIKYNRGDFNIADIEIVDFYKKSNNLKSYEDIGLKIHYNAINKEFIPMNMGFSKRSKLFSEKENLSFDKTKIVSIKNFPTIIDKNSIAYKFYLSLMQLKEEEITQDLYNKYFK